MSGTHFALNIRVRKNGELQDLTRHSFERSEVEKTFRHANVYFKNSNYIYKSATNRAFCVCVGLFSGKKELIDGTAYGLAIAIKLGITPELLAEYYRTFKKTIGEYTTLYEKNKPLYVNCDGFVDLYEDRPRYINKELQQSLLSTTFLRDYSTGFHIADYDPIDNMQDCYDDLRNAHKNIVNIHGAIRYAFSHSTSFYYYYLLVGLMRVRGLKYYEKEYKNVGGMKYLSDCDKNEEFMEFYAYIDDELHTKNRTFKSFPFIYNIYPLYIKQNYDALIAVLDTFYLNKTNVTYNNYEACIKVSYFMGANDDTMNTLIRYVEKYNAPVAAKMRKHIDGNQPEETDKSSFEPEE